MLRDVSSAKYFSFSETLYSFYIFDTFLPWQNSLTITWLTIRLSYFSSCLSTSYKRFHRTVSCTVCFLCCLIFHISCLGNIFQSCHWETTKAAKTKEDFLEAARWVHITSHLDGASNNVDILVLSWISPNQLLGGGRKGEIIYMYSMFFSCCFSLSLSNIITSLLFFLSSSSCVSFASSSSGKTFLRAPQMNINIATWGRLVRRAIPTVSTNSFSPQAAETGPSSLPGSPTPSRYSNTHTHSHIHELRVFKCDY